MTTLTERVEAPGLEQRSVLAWNLGLSACAILAGTFAVSPRFAIGVALGALIQLVNFRALWHVCQKVLLSGGSGAGLAVAAFGVRFVLLAVVVGVALFADANPFGLVVGLSMIVPAAVVAAWRARPRVLAAEPLAGPVPDDPSWDEWNPWLARERTPREEDPE